ncbi:MAG: hypothetical protein HC794_07355 [Nitrospiraceae bacterium]|nr:hypothetical protein [Nitrospiraceae bacterium]
MDELHQRVEAHHGGLPLEPQVLGDHRAHRRKIDVEDDGTVTGIGDLKFFSRIHHGGGTTFRFGATYVDQDGRFSIDEGLPVVESDDDAWIIDLSVEHRLPGRRGFISVGARNLFDESINLLEVDPFNPRVATEQFVYARLSQRP